MSKYGYYPWKPKGEYADLLADVIEVINANKSSWPMTQRYWLYKLKGAKGWTKEMEYRSPSVLAKLKQAGKEVPDRSSDGGLSKVLTRGMRARLIPEDAIACGRGNSEPSYTCEDADDMVETAIEYARRCQVDRQAGQDRRLVLWLESEGLFHHLQPIADEYSAMTITGKGFDVVKRKLEFKDNIIALDVDEVTVLHFGDLDRSGDTMWRSLEKDVTAFLDGTGIDFGIERIMLHEAQVHEFGLDHQPTPPPPAGNTHGEHFTSKVEAELESLDTDLLKDLVRQAFEDRLDMNLYEEQLQREMVYQREAVLRLSRARAAL